MIIVVQTQHGNHQNPSSRLNGWRIDCSIDYTSDCSIDCCLIDSLPDTMIDTMIDKWIDCFVARQHTDEQSSADRLFDCLID